MKLSIVIPNYNGEKILATNSSSVISALEFYTKKSGEEAELIYVDDGSLDDSISILKTITDALPRSIQQQTLIHKTNKGFSSAVNTGVAHAKGEIVILLNTDVRPEEGFIKPLLSHFLDTAVFAVGCMDKSVEGDRTVFRGRGIGRWEKGFLLHDAGKLDRTNTLWASGGSSAFRKSEWARLGGMNEQYNPFYWEDIDLSYRALKAGLQLRFEKESVVVHEHEEGAIKSQNSSTHIAVLSYRNQIQFVWLNITSKRLLFSHVLWLPYLLLRSILTSERLLYRGFVLALRNVHNICRYRSKMIKNFVKSDELVLASHRE